MLKKKSSLFVVFILLVFGLLTFQGIKGESRFVDFTLYPLSLIQKGTTTLMRSIRDSLDTYVLIAGKAEENRKLRDEISRLEQEKNEYVEIRLENERLKELLKLKSEKRDYVTTASVFARDPTNWFQTLWVNKGIEAGIAKEMVAVTPRGPVGMVRRVFRNEAQILLVTDVNSSVAVRLQPSRVEGILEGNGDDRCYMKYVSKEAEVNPGENVVTSGLDGIYPRGLLIGYVTSVNREGEESFQDIEVEPSQNLTSVEEVVILKR
jgi:rod shape-determining protein MreC